MVYKKFIFIAIIFLLSSCFMPEGWDDWKFTRPFWGVKNLPPADTEYGRGFEHGCSHGARVAGKGMLTEVIGQNLRVDELINNEQFALGYYDGYEQCTYILDWDVV